MADAAAGAATAAQPTPWLPDLAAAKALGLLCLAGLSVGFAALGASVVAIVACDYDEPCPVYRVLAATSVRAIVLAALLAPIAPLLVVRAAVCDPGFRDVLVVGLIRHLQTTMTRKKDIDSEDRKELHHLPLMLLKLVAKNTSD